MTRKERPPSVLCGEIGGYAVDGANLLIKNYWLEEPPKAVDHRELGLDK